MRERTRESGTDLQKLNGSMHVKQTVVSLKSFFGLQQTIVHKSTWFVLTKVDRGGGSLRTKTSYFRCYVTISKKSPNKTPHPSPGYFMDGHSQTVTVPDTAPSK